MSAPPSKTSPPPPSLPTTFNERLNEQLINCLNVQTNVIQNLAQYSQHISIQLFEIKNIVEMLSNRVLALQQQQQFSQQPHYGPNQYAASYYPNYMSQPPGAVPHPPPPSSHQHLPTVPPPVQHQPQQPVQMRMPNMTAPANPNLPFFPSVSTTFPSTSKPTNAPSFQFSTSVAGPAPSQTTATNTVAPTQTTPTKSFFQDVPKFGVTDISVKPASSSLPTTNNTNEKPKSSVLPTFGVTNLPNAFGAGSFLSGLSNNTTAKPEPNANDDDEAGGEDESYEPNVSFTPIVQLKAVEVKTGEEDEKVLFCERAKLYRYDSGTSQMKERGTGEMKILQHKTTNVCRILMRREQVLKLCANHQITAQIELKPHQGTGNAYLWSAVDFADGEPKHETLCVKFKTEEQAKNFAKVFNEAKGGNAKKSDDLPSVSKISLNDESKTKSTAKDDDVISIGEVQPSADQVNRAKQLQLPSTFFLYENKEPCKGCAGCEKDAPATPSNENKTAATKKPTDVVSNNTKTTAAQLPTSAPKTPLSSSENIKFSFNNADKSQPQLQKQTSTTKDEKISSVAPSSPAPNATSQYDNKPSIFGALNGTSGSTIFGSPPPVGNTNGSIFGGTASLKPASNPSGGFSFPGFGNPVGTPTAGFQFSTPTAAPTTSTSTANTSSTFSFGGSSNAPLFGTSPKFSFSDLAKQTSSTSTDKPVTNGTDQRVFAGQGSLIFGTGSVNTTATTENNAGADDDEAGGEDESYEPNVSFKPIVQLSAVEVKTGEEDENVLFCERGKLYRFDPDTNQMKERGTGEIKVLKHKTTNVYRILMRREQVLKLCANHQITAQMELKPHQGSENAHVWSAMDFADGEAKHETLCIRFKSSDTSKRFVQQFNEAKQANANA